MLPTSKKCPFDRATSRHQDPETLDQTLRAAGGGTIDPKTKERIPFYCWVCTRCGARWGRTEAGQDRSKHPEDRQPVQIATVAQPLTSTSKPLTPSSGSRPDVRVKSEGRMRPDDGAGYPGVARIQPTSQGAQAPTPWDALPDVMMIHSDLDEEDDPPL